MRVLSQKNSLLANLIISELKQKPIILNIQKFADTESLIEIDSNQISGETILLVWQFSFCEKNPANNQIFNFLLSADMLKKMGAKEIIGVLPYLPYSRQDESTLNLIGKLFKSAGVNKIFSIELHEPSIKENFAIEIEEIKISQFWADHLKNFKPNLCIVSPDKGRIEVDKQIANLLKADFAYVTKKRLKHDYAVALNLHGNVENKNVIIIDDILDTARTACSACELVLKNGAKSVTGCFGHAIFANDAIKRINKSKFEKIFITNTIPVSKEFLDKNKNFNVLNIGSLLCKILKKKI